MLEGTNRDVDDEPGEIEMRREQGRTKKKRQDGALSLGLLRKAPNDSPASSISFGSYFLTCAERNAKPNEPKKRKTEKEKKQARLDRVVRSPRARGCTQVAQPGECCP